MHEVKEIQRLEEKDGLLIYRACLTCFGDLEVAS